MPVCSKRFKSLEPQIVNPPLTFDEDYGLSRATVRASRRDLPLHSFATSFCELILLIIKK